MDPLTHTLVGASLAATGLRRKAALATATLIVAANLPDIDGVCQLMGTDAGLAGRRGITHGVVALVLLPIALAAIMFVLARKLASKAEARISHENEELDKGLVHESHSPNGPTSSQPPPLSFRWLLILSALGVATHPLLDLMNNYGVRLLMPFSPRWFYGDALFIIDPVVWLLAGAAVVFAWGHTKVAVAGWLLLLMATTAIVVVPKITPPGAKMLWCVGAGLLVFLRVREKSPPARATAMICLPLLAVYIGSMLWGSRHARNQTSEWLRARGMHADAVVAMPLPARPHKREVIALVNNSYHYFETSAFGDQVPRPTHAPLHRGQRDTPAVQAALTAPHVQGFLKWVRLPAFAERKTRAGYEVTLLDARYAQSPATRLGRNAVDLDDKLRVIPPGP